MFEHRSHSVDIWACFMTSIKHRVPTRAIALTGYIGAGGGNGAKQKVPTGRIGDGGKGVGSVCAGALDGQRGGCRSGISVQRRFVMVWLGLACWEGIARPVGWTANNDTLMLPKSGICKDPRTNQTGARSSNISDVDPGSCGRRADGLDTSNGSPVYQSHTGYPRFTAGSLY